MANQFMPLDFSTGHLAISKEVDGPGQCLPHGHRDSDDDGKEAPEVGWKSSTLSESGRRIELV